MTRSDWLSSSALRYSHGGKKTIHRPFSTATYKQNGQTFALSALEQKP
jgi:hypothetical protein